MSPYKWMMKEAKNQSLGISEPNPKILPWNSDPRGLKHNSDWPWTWLVQRSRHFVSSITEDNENVDSKNQF